jgi:hypothetical protein
MTLAHIIREAFDRPVSPERGYGCGRVYVSIVEKEAAKKVKEACKAIGITYQTKGHYGTTNVIYCGYDNADGNALARGTVVAETLKAQGIRCYREEHGD